MHKYPEDVAIFWQQPTRPVEFLIKACIQIAGPHHKNNRIHASAPAPHPQFFNSPITADHAGRIYHGMRQCVILPIKIMHQQTPTPLLGWVVTLQALTSMVL